MPATALTAREASQIMAGLKRAKVQTRSCPVRGHIEVFTDSPTEAGFRRWVEVPFTREALASFVA